MQTVLITGGTGLVGKALAGALLKKRYKVIILSRDLSGKQVNGNLCCARWDVKNQQIDITAIQDADHIIHLAGAGVVARKWSTLYKKEIIESRTESSRLLYETLKNNDNKVKTVISASAIGWYGTDTIPCKPFTEDMDAANDFLGHTCKLWEESIEPVTSLGKRLVKLRTGIVLSNGGGVLTEFRKPLPFGVAAILGNGNQMISWIHIDDLCRMYITAIENEKIHGSYNAVAPEPVTNKVLTITLAKAMRRNFYIPLHIPAFALKLMMGQRSIEVLKSTTVSCGKILATGFEFTFNNIKAALEDLSQAKDRHL